MKSTWHTPVYLYINGEKCYINYDEIRHTPTVCWIHLFDTWSVNLSSARTSVCHIFDERFDIKSVNSSPVSRFVVTWNEFMGVLKFWHALWHTRGYSVCNKKAFQSHSRVVSTALRSKLVHHCSGCISQLAFSPQHQMMPDLLRSLISPSGGPATHWNRGQRILYVWTVLELQVFEVISELTHQRAVTQTHLPPCYCCCCCRLQPGQIWESRICRRWQSRIPRRRRIIRPGRNHHGDRSLRRFWRGSTKFCKEKISWLFLQYQQPQVMQKSVACWQKSVAVDWLISLATQPACKWYISSYASHLTSLSLYIIYIDIVFLISSIKRNHPFWDASVELPHLKSPSIPSWRSQAKQKIRIESRSVVDCPEATNDSWQSHLRSWMKLVWYRKTLIPPSYTV